MKADLSENNRRGFWVEYNDIRDTNNKLVNSLSTFIIATSAAGTHVWIDTYGNDNLMTTHGHLTPEDARILGETLIKAADIIEKNKV